MKVLVTGSKGFIGRNLVSQLYNINKNKSDYLTTNFTVYEYETDTNPELLDLYTKDCEFVFHLAGVNRPSDEKEFMEGNFNFTAKLLFSLSKNKNKAPILMTSSNQAELDNPYGKSKLQTEKLIFRYGQDNNVETYIYRLPNVFGKWCRPNYNSVIATFCHNIANGLDIAVNDPEVIMNLVYIDDVISSFISKLEVKNTNNEVSRFLAFEEVKQVYTIRLGDIVSLLYYFNDSRADIYIPKTDGAFEKALYSTYLSYLPNDRFCYPLKMNVDSRGSFTEIIRIFDTGQFSVNTLKPSITKGNHWHNHKVEKFIVVSGKGILSLRKIGTDNVIKYNVNGEKVEAVDVPPGYIHALTNEGDSDLVSVIWCNECFNPQKPDTFYEEV